MVDDDILATILVKVGQPDMQVACGGHGDGDLDRRRLERIGTGTGEEHGEFVPAVTDQEVLEAIAIDVAEQDRREQRTAL